MKQPWLSVLSIGAICLVTTLSGCSSEPPEEVQIIRPVMHSTVGVLGGSITRTFSGTAETDKSIDLSFRNGGIITLLHVRVGQRVKKGELLARLDNVQARLSYEQSVSSLNSAASQMNTAKLGLDRVRVLYEKGSASLSEFESAKNSFKTAQSSHESAKRSVSIQEEQIRFGFIYAPEDGIISAVRSELDENVSAGQTVAVLSAGTDKEIALGLPESVINYVTEGMAVSVAFPALPGQVFTGVVKEASPSIDPSTSTYPVRARITGSTQNLRAGMAAEVTFSFRSGNGQGQMPVVPASAVGDDGESRFVFLITPSGETATVNKRRIRVGNLSSEGFEVIEGLQPGDLVVTAGLQTLLDGQVVRLQAKQP